MAPKQTQRGFIARPSTPPAPNSLAASADIRQTPRRGELVRLGEYAKRTGNQRNTDGEWQAEAFKFLVLIGELGFAADVYANKVSRGTMRVVEKQDASVDKVATKNEKVLRVWGGLRGSKGGLNGLTWRAVKHMFAAGESHLVGEPVSDTEISWSFLSTSELKQDGNNYTRTVGPSQKEELPVNGYISHLYS